MWSLTSGDLRLFCNHEMEERMIKNFEDLCVAGTDKEIAVLKGIDPETIIKAYIGI